MLPSSTLKPYHTCHESPPHANLCTESAPVPSCPKYPSPSLSRLVCPGRVDHSMLVQPVLALPASLRSGPVAPHTESGLAGEREPGRP